MRTKNKAGRSRQRTAHSMLESLPGMIAFYGDSLLHSMVKGLAIAMRGRPYFIGALGTIETKVRTMADRPVVIDTRAIIGAPERVTRDGFDLGRCVVTLALSNGRTIRIGLDAPRDTVEAAILKARA
jgi:hypothetical protein